MDRRTVSRALGITIVGFLLATGCGHREAYQQIELGKPVPQAHWLRAVKGSPRGSSRGYGDWWPVPLVFAFDNVEAFLDKDGNVSAKTYLSITFAHCGLLQWAESHRVLDVVVPPEAFREPPPKYPSKQSPHVLDYIHHLPNLRVESLPGQDLAGEWAIGLLPALAGIHYQSVIEAIDERMPSALIGITQEGFDRTYTKGSGRIRIRNMGGRRILVESQAFTLGDPFMLSAFLFARSDEEYRKDSCQSVLSQQTRAIEAHPRDPLLRLARAGTWEYSGDWERAMADYAKAAELAASDTTYLQPIREARARAKEYLDNKGRAPSRARQ